MHREAEQNTLCRIRKAVLQHSVYEGAAAAEQDAPRVSMARRRATTLWLATTATTAVARCRAGLLLRLPGPVRGGSRRR